MMMTRRSIVLGLCCVVLGVGRLSAQQPAEKPPAAEPHPSQRWENAIAKMEAADSKSPPTKEGILFVGSSSIRLWDLAKTFPYHKPINRGFGGSEIADSTYFAERIIFPHRPKLIFLYAGDNDIAKGKSAEIVHRDYLRFVDKVHKRLPETNIVFIAIKPSIKRWELVEEMRKANALIQAETKKDHRLGFADIDAPMIGADGTPKKELFLDDGLHLNAEGYKVWSRVLVPFFQALK